MGKMVATKYRMRNFSISLQEIKGKWYEPGYYEYTGYTSAFRTQPNP